MNRTKLLTALFAAGFLTTGAMAQGAKPTKPAKPAMSAAATADTTKKPPVMHSKKKGHKPVKPDTTKTKKPN